MQYCRVSGLSGLSPAVPGASGPRTQVQRSQDGRFSAKRDMSSRSGRRCAGRSGRGTFGGARAAGAARADVNGGTPQDGYRRYDARPGLVTAHSGLYSRRGEAFPHLPRRLCHRPHDLPSGPKSESHSSSRSCAISRYLTGRLTFLRHRYILLLLMNV